MKEKELAKKWCIAAGVRAIRTFAQTFVAFLTVGASMADIDWKLAASVSVVAMIASILTSIATGIPEVSLKEEEDDDNE